MPWDFGEGRHFHDLCTVQDWFTFCRNCLNFSVVAQYPDRFYLSINTHFKTTSGLSCFQIFPTPGLL